MVAGCNAHGVASASLTANGGLSASATGEASAKSSAKADAKLGDRVTLVDDKLEYDGEIEFKYDSAILQGKDTVATLAQVRDVLKAHGDVRIHIEGHADSRGDDDYNRKLSDSRARSIVRWLVEGGVSESRLTSKGYGADKAKEPPRCRDKTGSDATFKGDSECLEAWRKNRRTVLRVVAGVETLKASPPVEAKRVEPPARRADPPECPLRLGARAGVLGPGVHGSLAFAIEPVCPVELSVGVGAKLATAYVSLPTGSEVNDRQKESAFALMLRARFWFLREHSPILDVGLASSRYSGGESFGHASFAVGYGYRSAEPVRLGIVIGAMAPPAGMGSTAGFGEVSVGVMW
jgi:outer membrane protein OmpA-like peptidoglycan-associated protein